MRVTPPLRVEPLEDRCTPAFTGGVNVAAADVNGDGFIDVITAAGPTGGPHVRVFSGNGGGEIASFFPYAPGYTGGVNVAAADMDGDGAAEIVTAPVGGGGPHVKVFSGNGQSERLGVFAFAPSFTGGVSIAAADLDGDGKAEIVAGAGQGGGPHVRVLDGLTGVEEGSFFPYDPGFTGGVNVAAGNVSGQPEVITGVGVGGGPHVKTFTPTGGLKSEFFPYDSGFRGGVVVAAGDLDGDGRDEVLTAAGPGGGPHLRVFDGVSGAEEGSFFAYDPGFGGGVKVAVASTLDGGRIITGVGPGGGPHVKLFTPGGSEVSSFFPFDPVTPASLNLPAAVGGGDPGDLDPPDDFPTPPLAVSTPVIGANTSEPLVFSGTYGPAVSRVQLFEADAAGQVGDYLVDLFDDGLFVHRDAVAGDGIFSNALTVNLPAGDHYYATVVPTIRQPDVRLARVEAVGLPSDSAAAARDERVDRLQGELTAALAGGTPTAAALERVRAEVAADPTVEAVDVTPNGVFWRTADGAGQGVVATFDSGLRAGGGGGGDTVYLAATGDDCKGRALVLAPYFFEFNPGGGDESDEIVARLQAEGYDVTYKANAAVTVEDFKDFAQYDAVVVTSHGELWNTQNDPDHYYTNNQTVIFTGQKVVPGTDPYKADIAAGRVQNLGGEYAVTPLFFANYSGQMDDTVVYIGACRSARSNALGNTFLNLGAAAYLGYTDYVGSAFAAPLGEGIFTHLLADGTVGTIPNVGKTETDSDPARFRLFTRTPDAKLTPSCDLLMDYDLELVYTWATTQRDLDTGTSFLGGSVGFACPGSPYMSFSGDDTSAGGQETIVVDLYEAFQAGAWDDSTSVNAVAGWYIPAGGSGPATVTVGLKPKAGGQTIRSVQQTISPGAQRDCAVTVVGTASITETGEAGQERIEFTYA